MNNSYLTNTMYNAGIYIRLSQEDRDKKYESDSESVTNQKEILRDYCLKNGFNLIDEYVDMAKIYLNEYDENYCQNHVYQLI